MFEIRIAGKAEDIGAEKWHSVYPGDYPFLSYEFIHALEQTRCVCDETGWYPLHLIIEQQQQLIAILPLYLKTHSWGEYVFDWAWADAYERHQLEYYPKLLTAAPYTPAWGPRLLTRQDPDQLWQALAKMLPQLCDQLNCSSWHGLFLSPAEQQSLASSATVSRLGCQYHWFNEGFSDFTQFLATFNSRKRKNLRKERQKAQQQAEIKRVQGEQINDLELRQFYRYYHNTYLKRGRSGYLNLEFFQQLIETMAPQLMMVQAWQQDRMIAAALFFKDDSSLYGRYWGSDDDYQHLHFECCYYQGIEYCIEQGLKRFDPGAQGEHKIQRGFRPVETWSVHWIQHSGFRDAVSDFVVQEEQQMRQLMLDLETKLPFKNND